MEERQRRARNTLMTIHTLQGDGSEVLRVSIDQFLQERIGSLRTGKAKLRWLHMPVNNMRWVEECVEKWYPGSPGLDDRLWTHKLRPALSQIASKPLHSRHMEPSCIASDESSLDVPIPGFTQEYSHDIKVVVPQITVSTDKQTRLQPIVTLYLPYMNWESCEDYRSLAKVYKRPRGPGIGGSERKNLQNQLAVFLIDSPSLHPRRSLDQFYYSSLKDTTKRDEDQTISKWTGSGLTENGRLTAADDSKMIMVDQLWCWVLDDQTILSCFPSDELQYDEEGFTDLYTSMLQSWEKCEDVWDLYSTLVREATTYLFRQDNKTFLDLIETYRWVIGKKAAAQTTHFQDFHTTHSQGQLESTLLDDQEELKLVLDVADILDELKMIRHIVEKQREVLKSLALALLKVNPSREGRTPNTTLNVDIYNNSASGGAFQMNTVHFYEALANLAETIKALAQGISGAARETIVSADEVLVLLLADIDGMRGDAEYTHQLLLNLLDLKQKAAALAEARSTSQQGRVILLFTIVTIVFLPLSFFATFFGQNVSEITGDGKNPAGWDLWRYGTPLSVVVIFSALLIAYYITKPHSRLWFWRRVERGVDV